MKFIGDVPIGRATIQFLQELGHDSIRAIDRVAPTAADEEVVRVAIDEARVILCFDLDFGAIIAASGRTAPSTITFRTRLRSPGYINRRLAQVLPLIEADLVRGALVVVEDSRVRVRRLPVGGAGRGTRRTHEHPG